MEAVMAARLGWAVEDFDLLPRCHVGARRGPSTEHAVHMLVEKIQFTWESKEVASLLLLDVSGVSENASHQGLLHNLRKRRIGSAILNWIASFIAHRVSKIWMADFISREYHVSIGIPQGSPISLSLYLFYNADLVEALIDASLSSMDLAYIDDVDIITSVMSAEENVAVLRQLHDRVE